MGNITLEQIDLIMQRANVSYTEAKEALEQCGGDTVEALLLLEKANKVKPQAETSSNNNASNTANTCKGFFSKLHATSFIIRKGENTIINIPLTVAILALIFCCYISIVGLVIALILGYKVEIIGENTVAEKINSTIDLMKK